MTAAEVFLVMLTLTVAGYALGRALQRRTASALANPVLIGSGFVIAALLATGTGLAEYGTCRRAVTTFLGPATVALALPLYHARRALAARLAVATIGVVCGSFSVIVTVVALSHWLALTPMLVLALSLKGVTAPIAVELARMLGGNAEITAILVVATGVTGGVVGPGLLDWARVSDPVARGLAVGTTSHAIGAAIMLQEGEVQGAMASVAFSLNAVVTAFVAPFLLPWLLALGAHL